MLSNRNSLWIGFPSVRQVFGVSCQQQCYFVPLGWPDLVDELFLVCSRVMFSFAESILLTCKLLLTG